jgi:hypothetical protein
MYSVYQDYPYDITPPTDDHPFFFHFFTWSQTPEVIQNLGKTWQPFGGSGFFLLVFLLALVILLSGILILLPLSIGKKVDAISRSSGKFWVLLYFGLIGIGFMFLEIPLISQWRLFLNKPIAAFSAVVGTLLLSSGLGSISVGSDWDRKKEHYTIIAILGTGLIVFSVIGKDIILGLPSWMRYLIPCILLGPAGYIMGTFFPRGISWIKMTHPDLVPWAWAINGSISVVASIITAILSLEFGYGLILLIGGVAYLAAWLILKVRGN